MMKTSLKRNPNTVIAVCVSCALMLYLLTVITPRQSGEDFSLCNDGIEYLLSEYKGLAALKKTLQKEKYLEVKELKSSLKKATVDLQLKEEEYSNEIHSLNSSVSMWKKKTFELQRLLDGAFSTMDRSSVVLTTVLQALQKAEARVEQLERQLSHNNATAVG